MGSGHIWLVGLTIIMLLAPASSALGYIDAPAEKLTLPQLMKEFKSVGMLRARRVDAERGKVIWEVTEQIQGLRNEEDMRHQVTLNGRVPEEFGDIKPGTTAVCFWGDRWKRCLTLVAGHWYVCDADPDGAWWRMSFTEKHYDFHCCFTGSVVELRDALRTLAQGKPVVVRCRTARRSAKTQQVRYYPDKPDRKEPVAQEPADNGRAPQRTIVPAAIAVAERDSTPRQGR
jgi:hypothetical protein